MYKFIVVFLFVSLFSNQSNANGLDTRYKVDKSITEEVNSNIEYVYEQALGTMEIKVYENDILLTYDEDKDKYGNVKPQLGFITSMRNDTISIIGFDGFAMAWRFYLDLYHENYKLSFMIHADTEIYKYTKDGDLHFTLSVPCTYTSCVLTSKPTFKKENVVSGVVELKSNDFWQLANGKENKYRVELKAYFSAKEAKVEEVDFDIEELINSQSQ